MYRVDMEILRDLLKNNEDWLMERTLDYAKARGYAAYTSTLKEPWRLSISGLTASIVEAVSIGSDIPEMGPDLDFTSSPIALFGIVEAQRHRERGIDLGMFLGLFKYYRQAYLDLINSQDLSRPVNEELSLFVTRVFDHLEIGFCLEWSGGDNNRVIHEMQVSNRSMTNEKNKYLTIFESIPNPVVILNRGKKIDNMNLAAARFFKEGVAAGAQYYCLARDRQLEMELCLDEAGEGFDPSCLAGQGLSSMLPWLEREVDEFYNGESSSVNFEKTVGQGESRVVYRVKLSKSLDISAKFDGILIILEDITTLKDALEEVKTLRGFVPICANCKNIRDDQGYWQQVEEYVQAHSEAQFSHSICPACVKKLYPELYDESIE